jgi:O-antigen/teichoic acid export membrane protein
VPDADEPNLGAEADEPNLGAEADEPNLGAQELGATPANDNLRSSALQGGAYLAAREIVGIGIRMIGVVIVTRLIGPSSFGVYASAAAFVIVVAVMAQMGMEVYLIRQTEEPSTELYDQVFTFLLVVSVGLSAVAAGLVVMAQHLIHGFEPTGRVTLVLLISVPFNVLWSPAQAKIERRFGYRHMAWLELGGDITLYAVAVILAFAGAGAMSLAIAYVAWQIWLLVGSCWLAKLQPRWNWSGTAIRDLVRHGVPYSTSAIVAMLKGLINPIVVGYFYGTTGVGYVALALRLVDTLGFAGRATWRLSLVAMTRVREQRDRLQRGIQEGMLLQLLGSAAPIVALAMLAKWIVPLAFGSVWLPAVPVLILLSNGRLITAPLTLEYAFLYTHSRNTLIVVATAINTAVTFGLAIPFVAWLGINGFGWAALIGSVTWIHLHMQARRIVPYSYLPLLPYYVAMLPVTTFSLLRWPVDLLVFVPGIIVLMMPSIRAELAKIVRVTWTGVVRRGVVH